ncbi:hypothetical protein ACLBKU_12095 [Erythrobacter sp. NE805]|uniref:hypothetical protein n=1 Tax=Erythrobacter sp. NE805 TaxID=3389875 RepID=UPI00396B4487
MMRTIIAKLAIREFWMFTIAGVGMITLAVIGVLAAFYGVPKSSEAVLTAIVTLIGLRVGDVINAIRALWRVSQEHIEAEPGEKP